MTGQLRRSTIRFLLGDNAAAAEIENSGTWLAAVALSKRWNVVPSLRARIEEAGIVLPGPCRADVEQLVLAAFVQTGRCLKSGVDALTILQKSGLPCAGFKGLATVAHAQEKDERQRVMSDVDIVIRPEDARSAIERLQESGYRAAIKGPIEDYMLFVRQSPGSAGNEAVSLFNAKGAGVDVHWRLGRADLSALLAEAQQSPVLGRPVPVTSMRHSVAMAAHHALRNNFDPDKIIRDLLDFKMLSTHPNVVVDRVLEAASAWNVTAPLFALDRITSAACGTGGTWLQRHAAAADHRKAEDLAGLYWHQLEHGTLNPDLVYLADAHPLLQIAGAAATGWTRFRATMRSMDSLKGEPESLGHRLGNLLTALPRLPLRHWRQVRTLAVAKQQLM